MAWVNHGMGNASDATGSVNYVMGSASDVTAKGPKAGILGAFGQRFS